MVLIAVVASRVAVAIIAYGVVVEQPVNALANPNIAMIAIKSFVIVRILHDTSDLRHP